MSKVKNYSNYEEEICVVCETNKPEEVRKESKHTQDTLLVLVLSALLIVIGCLATLAIFLEWTTFMMYLVAGIGFMCIIGGLIFLACAIIGVWD